MKIVAIIGLFLLCLLPVQVKAEGEIDLAVCNDSLFQAIKVKDLSTLQDREYEYFKRYDADCNRMKALAFEKEKEKSGQALKMVGSILNIFVSLGLLVYIVLWVAKEQS